MLSGIRTVASLNSEEIELERYGKHIDGAYHAGIKEGMAKGLGNGMLYASFYMSYALAFWFGTKQVRETAKRTPTAASYCVNRSIAVCAVPSFCSLFHAVPLASL